MGCHFLLWGNLPHPGIQPASLVSPAFEGRFFTTEPPGKLRFIFNSCSHIPWPVHQKIRSNTHPKIYLKIHQQLTLPIITALVHDTHSSWLNDFENTPPPICFPKIHTLPLGLLSTQHNCHYPKILFIFKFFCFLFFYFIFGHCIACGGLAGDLGSIPGLGGSPGGGNGNPLQCSCLENAMDGASWWATVHGVTRSRT